MVWVLRVVALRCRATPFDWLPIDYQLIVCLLRCPVILTFAVPPLLFDYLPTPRYRYLPVISPHDVVHYLIPEPFTRSLNTDGIAAVPVSDVDYHPPPRCPIVPNCQLPCGRYTYRAGGLTLPVLVGGRDGIYLIRLTITYCCAPHLIRLPVVDVPFVYQLTRC